MGLPVSCFVLFIWCVYMTAHHDFLQYRETLSDIQDLVATYSQQGTFIIAGEFNASITSNDLASNTRTSSKSAILSEFVLSNNLVSAQTSCSPPNGCTFILTKNAIYHILFEETSICNIEKFSILPESEILTSDHLPLCMSYTVECVLRPSSPFKKSIVWVKCSDTVLESYHNEFYKNCQHPFRSPTNKTRMK